MRDFKNEILENDDITFIGRAELLKQLLFDVCKEQEFILSVGDMNIFDEYLMLTRTNNTLFLERILDEKKDLITISSDILWLDDDILQYALSKKQDNRILCDRDLVFIY